MHIHAFLRLFIFCILFSLSVVDVFVCWVIQLLSRARARELTYALAASFQEYSKRVKEIEQNEMRSNKAHPMNGRKKFAVDLRLPEEMHQTIEDQETEA